MTKSCGSSGLFLILIIVLVVGVITLGTGVYNTQVACKDTQESCEASKAELVNVREQLRRAEQGQWFFFLGGLLGGWLLNLVTPAKFLNFTKGLLTGSIKQNQKEIKKIVETPLREHIQTDSIITNHPNVSGRKLPQVSQPPPIKLCPKCSSPMEIQMATKGEHKGKRFFVCPNYQQCQQFYPFD